MLYAFFFFQAEDGIRDYKVTGVQTCALPIYNAAPDFVLDRGHVFGAQLGDAEKWALIERSEERRVGKECRWRWRPNNKKKEKKLLKASERSIRQCQME